jgi:hypothetical protein
MDEAERDEFYRMLADLQDALGAINDHAVAINYLQEVREEIRSKSVLLWIDSEIPRRDQELVAAHQEFLKEWPARHNALTAAWDKISFVSAANGLEKPSDELVSTSTQAKSIANGTDELIPGQDSCPSDVAPKNGNGKHTTISSAEKSLQS